MFQNRRRGTGTTGSVRAEKLFHLKRYQKETTLISTTGDMKPVVRSICKQTHVSNKPYAICRFQKNILENFNKWPVDTWFEIEPVS